MENNFKECNNDNNRIINLNGVDYKLRKVIEKTATNIHHIIWNCNRNEYHTNKPENKMTINMIRHQCINDLFWNLQSPHEQFRFMWEIRKPVLSRGVNMAIYDILNLPRDLFYKEELIKWKDRTKSLWKDGWGKR